MRETFTDLYNSPNFIYIRYISAIIIVLLTFPISSILTQKLQDTDYKNEDFDKFFQTGLSILLIRFATMFVLILIALKVANVNNLVIASYAGILLIAVPAAMSTQISNYISGLLLIAFDRITLNDYIIIDDFEGRIKKLNLFSIEVKDEFTKKTRFIPNADFWTKSFINVSKNTTAVAKIEITVASDNDFDEIEDKILNIIDNNFEGIDASKTRIRYDHSIWGVKLSIAVEVPSKKYFEYKMLLLRVIRKKISEDEDINFVM
ncbi:putative small conductance mechanosensetive channel protein [Aureococcus anophagefferens virus]|uniref:Putative small conductance mechanosensetive channel protein n=1 Tax=Aureococcus anophagefferens virus TaxID=1474867 RepID=A0A076FGK6_9VIRU|nr:putative small conductance mechanosensetive channel protein [Aureococcus anophagefferens virus]AII17220.1 putative small conductance mechanosensetive channel protein [Aureococcus anophagefferens virus]UOG94345.1 hypothetical protein MKD35_310 [Aureococcus anophagefferens virus]